MPLRTRLLILSVATLLIAPGRWAGAQAVVESRLPVRLSAGLAWPSDTGDVRSAAVAAERPVPGRAPSADGADAAARSLAVDPAATARRGRRSLGRRVGRGAAAGAAAGVLTGLTVLAMCDSYCEGARGRGLALHVGVGATIGGAIGVLIHHVRD